MDGGTGKAVLSMLVTVTVSATCGGVIKAELEACVVARVGVAITVVSEAVVSEAVVSEVLCVGVEKG